MTTDIQNTDQNSLPIQPGKKESGETIKTKTCPECKQTRNISVKARNCPNCGYPFFGLHTPWRIRTLDISVAIGFIGWAVIDLIGPDLSNLIIHLGLIGYITTRIMWWERYRVPKRPKNKEVMNNA